MLFMRTNKMGMRGTRGNRNADALDNGIYKSIDDIIRLAEKEGYYNGKKLQVVKLAKYFGLNVVEKNFEQNISGKLVIGKGPESPSVIYVNSNHSENRKRFTIAHELGHFINHRKDGAEFEDTVFFRKGDIFGIEYSANKFAADILMPESEVRKSVIEGIRDVGSLAEEFGVSASAMKYRLEQLGFRLI